MVTQQAASNPPRSRDGFSTRCLWPGWTLAALMAGLGSCKTAPVRTENATERQASIAGAEAGGRTEIRPYYYDYATAGSDAGDVALNRVGAEVLHAFQPADDWAVELSGRTERARYSIPGLDSAVPASPGLSISSLETYEVGLAAAYRTSETFSHHLYGIVTASAESGVDAVDALRGTLLLASRYAINPKLGVLFGLATFSRLEGDPLTAPVLGLDWKPDEEWELLLGLPETSLSYAPTNELSFALSFGFEFNDYRLDQPGALDGGVLESELVTLELSTEWALNDHVKASLIAGQPALHELEVLNSSGGTEFETSVELKPFVGLVLSIAL